MFCSKNLNNQNRFLVFMIQYLNYFFINCLIHQIYFQLTSYCQREIFIQIILHLQKIYNHIFPMKLVQVLLIVLLFPSNSVLYDTTVNFISNPNFSVPYQGISNWPVLAKAGAWSQVNNQIQIGPGYAYNSRWTSGQVCELAVDNNSNIYQSINIDAGYYQLNITWAARQNQNLATSQWSVYWNDLLVKFFTPVDYQIHKETLNVIANQGTNKLSLRGQGTNDNYGATVSLVQLYGQNNIQNGNFETPSTRKGWRVLKSAGQWSSYTNQIKIGQGTMFNSVWKTGQIAQLDAYQNSQIYQVVSIPAGKYYLRFDWAARTGVQLRSNSFSVLWNSVGITFITPPDYLIHTFNTDVQASQGNNILSLRGEGISDSYGVDIDNVRLWRAV